MDSFFSLKCSFFLLAVIGSLSSHDRHRHIYVDTLTAAVYWRRCAYRAAISFRHVPQESLRRQRINCAMHSGTSRHLVRPRLHTVDQSDIEIYWNFTATCFLLFMLVDMPVNCTVLGRGKDGSGKISKIKQPEV